LKNSPFCFFLFEIFCTVRSEDNVIRRAGGGKQTGATFTIVLQAEPHIDAIRNLRIALKVLKRRFGLRVVTIREEP